VKDENGNIFNRYLSKNYFSFSAECVPLLSVLFGVFTPGN
jgi:hypothetical protein